MLWEGEGVWKQGETCLGRSPRDGERVGFRVLGLGLRVREGGSSGERAVLEWGSGWVARPRPLERGDLWSHTCSILFSHL